MNDILESLFQEFLRLHEKESGDEFGSFQSSRYFSKHENYKYQIYDEAQTKLGRKSWGTEDIGSGKIQKAVSSATYTSSETNNLINWRQTGDFKKRPYSPSLEKTFYYFFKNRQDVLKDEDAFKQFLGEGLSYQFAAYLFFIKDKNKYLPISQERFDAIFEMIGREDFKTTRNSSWENYTEFCAIIKQVREFLKTKDSAATLLDAHSFLWIMGNRNNTPEAPPVQVKIPPLKLISTHVDEEGKGTLSPPSEFSTISIEQWIEILSNEDLTNEYDLDLFQTMLRQPDYKGFAGQIGVELGHTGATPQSPINSEIGRYGKRIASKYQVQLTQRDDETTRYWDLFFLGAYEGSKFAWQLKPELVSALIAIGLDVEAKSPDELPDGTTFELYEGLKRTITVNSYERSSKARLLCVNHWKPICSVCKFDFEKVYGKIGKGFIHVHHLTPVSEVGETYKIDPIRDLRPVCPNCHAMLHTGEKRLSIEELKRILASMGAGTH